jgi:hypothetical protein
MELVRNGQSTKEKQMENGLYMVSNDAKLYRLDSATGSAGLIGSINIQSVTDLAFQGPTLWGLTFTQFIRIDPRTGAGVVIGNTTQNDLNGLAVSRDGEIYSAGFNSQQLMRIDPVTGSASPVGALGGFTSSGDLAFDSNNQLYGALNNAAGNLVLATINPTTGAAAAIGNIGSATCYGLAFHCCRLYGVTATGEVLSINCATGAGTVIGRNGIDQYGLSSAPSCCY